MDWLALLFDVRGTHRLRSVFEEGVLAHQPIRRWRRQRHSIDTQCYFRSDDHSRMTLPCIAPQRFEHFLALIRAEGSATP